MKQPCHSCLQYLHTMRSLPDQVVDLLGQRKGQMMEMSAAVGEGTTQHPHPRPAGAFCRMVLHDALLSALHHIARLPDQRHRPQVGVVPASCRSVFDYRT